MRHYGSNKKADLVSGLKDPKDNNLRDKIGKEKIAKDVFIKLLSSSLKALTCEKEKKLGEHLIQNLDCAILLKNFSWSSNSALNIPVKINGHSVTDIVDTERSGVIVSRGCAD